MGVSNLPHTLAQPPGCRTCVQPGGDSGAGGVWEYPELAGGTRPFGEDLLREMARYHRNVGAMLRQEIKDKLHRGSKGELTFGRGGEYDVDQMDCAAEVLEIRLSTQYGDEAEKLCTRIYFTEPAFVPESLRLISVETKHPEQFSSEEQTRHARAAQSRLFSCETWYLG